MSLPFRVAQWFGLGTPRLEVSSWKSVANKSKGFAFWVELVAQDLLSVGYSLVWFVSYCIGAGVLPYVHPKDSGCDLVIKK